MAEYGEWNRKGATLSDVTAKAEYGVSRDFIVKGIQTGKLEYREGSIWGNPYLRVLRSQLEKYIAEEHGEDYLLRLKNQTELRRVRRKYPISKRDSRGFKSGRRSLRYHWANDKSPNNQLQRTEKRPKRYANITEHSTDSPVMSVEAKKILEQALHLPQHERAVVAEGLLSSLDRPDPTIDELWAKEAEARLDAAERGEMGTVSEQEVFAKYEKR